MKGLVNCHSFSRAPVARVLVAKLRPLGETVGLSRVRDFRQKYAQAGRGPQWPIHRKRQMTVTDGRESAILSFPLQPLRPHNARARTRARNW
jgi:hypothetical protein